MRQQNLFLKERWMPLRQQTLVDQLFASTKLVASPWAGLTKQLYKQFPKGLLYVQVVYKYIVNFTSDLKSSLSEIYKLLYKCHSVLISVHFV